MVEEEQCLEGEEEEDGDGLRIVWEGLVEEGDRGGLVDQPGLDAVAEGGGFDSVSG